jgi:hypothetical protein
MSGGPAAGPTPRRRGLAGADRWGRSLELPVADPAAVQTRTPEAPMHDR